MSSDVIVEKRFREEALNLILSEAQRMRAQNEGYTSVIFETRGKGITILYAGQGFPTGQLQQHPQELWSLLDLAMPLVSAMGHHRIGKILSYYTQPTRQTNRWRLDTEPLGDAVEPFLIEVLQKVDEAYISFFNNSLATPASPLPSPCRLCGASLVQEDGGDNFYCPEGCLI